MAIVSMKSVLCWLWLAVLCLELVLAQYGDINDVTDNADRFSDPTCKQCLTSRDLTYCAFCLARSESRGSVSEYKRSSAMNEQRSNLKQGLAQYVACECCASGDNYCCDLCQIEAMYANEDDVISSEKRSIFSNPQVPYFRTPFGVDRYRVYGKRNVPGWVRPYYIYGGKRAINFRPIPPFVDSKRSSIDYNQLKEEKRARMFRNFYKTDIGKCSCCERKSYNFKCCLYCASRR